MESTSNDRRQGTPRLWCLVLICWLASGQVMGAEPEPPRGAFFEPLEVPLVSLEVFVSDADGNPVSDLTAADFEVFGDGEPVEISHFYAAGQTAAEPTAEAETDADARDAPSQALFITIYLDLTNFNLNRMQPALENLRSFFAQDLPQNLRVAQQSWVVHGKLVGNDCRALIS